MTERDQYIGVVLESNPKTSNAAKCRKTSPLKEWKVIPPYW
ncbi:MULTISPECIES: hypothetical protein [unclassified Pseudomonas]|nr:MULTISPECIES: hypothetical protein [unclassified Pseudomonas]